MTAISLTPSARPTLRAARTIQPWNRLRPAWLWDRLSERRQFRLWSLGIDALLLEHRLSIWLRIQGLRLRVAFLHLLPDA